jgi:hypothetical protein
LLEVCILDVTTITKHRAMTIQEAIDIDERKLKGAKTHLQRQIIDLTDRMHEMTMKQYQKELKDLLRYFGGHIATLEHSIEQLEPKKQ